MYLWTVSFLLVPNPDLGPFADHQPQSVSNRHVHLLLCSLRWYFGVGLGLVAADTFIAPDGIGSVVLIFVFKVSPARTHGLQPVLCAPRRG